LGRLELFQGRCRNDDETLVVLQRDTASLFASPELEIEAAVNVTRVEFVTEEWAGATGLEPAASCVTGSVLKQTNNELCHNLCKCRRKLPVAKGVLGAEG
jgi:hypothetical protein